jgi:hypothetical protein
VNKIVDTTGHFFDSMLAQQERSREEFGIRSPYARMEDVSFTVLGLGLGVQQVVSLPFDVAEPNAKDSHFVTVVIYPGHLALSVESELSEMLPVTVKLKAIAPDLIPIDGEINVRISPSLSNDEAFSLAARTIQDKINPPFGVWGDPALPARLTAALESESASIFAVPSMRLKHAVTGVVIELLDIKPWSLLEVQQTLTFNWLR